MEKYFTLIRPHQYVKNLFIFLPVFFAMQAAQFELLVNAAIAFVAFSLSASAVYILNDYQDITEDQKHPIKKHRPLAVGSVSCLLAFFLMALLAMSGLGLMFALSIKAFYVLLGYIGLNIAYSYGLKNIAILDILIISLGFVLRVFIGSFVTGIDFSMWITLMTFLLALFLALAKRRDDVLLFNQTGHKMRISVEGYNLKFIDQAMSMMAAVVLVSYVMYCVSAEVIARTNTDKLYLTAIFVIVGILRYMQLTFVMEKSGSPTKIVLGDAMIQIAIFLWFSTFVILLY